MPTLEETQQRVVEKFQQHSSSQIEYARKIGTYLHILSLDIEENLMDEMINDILSIQRFPELAFASAFFIALRDQKIEGVYIIEEGIERFTKVTMNRITLTKGETSLIMAGNNVSGWSQRPEPDSAFILIRTVVTYKNPR